MTPPIFALLATAWACCALVALRQLPQMIEGFLHAWNEIVLSLNRSLDLLWPRRRGHAKPAMELRIEYLQRWYIDSDIDPFTVFERVAELEDRLARILAPRPERVAAGGMSSQQALAGATALAHSLRACDCTPCERKLADLNARRS